ncbi:hypothetical protein ACQJBY_021237 [Aegilops geniculata]
MIPVFLSSSPLFSPCSDPDLLSTQVVMPARKLTTGDVRHRSSTATGVAAVGKGRRPPLGLVVTGAADDRHAIRRRAPPWEELRRASYAVRYREELQRSSDADRAAGDRARTRVLGGAMAGELHRLRRHGFTRVKRRTCSGDDAAATPLPSPVLPCSSGFMCGPQHREHTSFVGRFRPNSVQRDPLLILSQRWLFHSISRLILSTGARGERNYGKE